MNLLVSGTLAYDRIMDFNGYFKDHILPQKIHILNVSFYVEKFRQSFGGTAGNIAYNLSLLGMKPIVLSAYGNDFDIYQTWCNKHHINLRYTRKVKEVVTASAYIITDKSDNQITGFFAGAMSFNNNKPPVTLLKESSLAIIAPGNPHDMNALTNLYRRSGVKYIYDPGQQITVLNKKDMIKSLAGAYGLISNDYELSMIMKKTGLSLQKLLAQIKIIVTTKGEKGSVILSGKNKYIIPPAKPKNTSDPTGAGDAYRAGFIKGLVAGFPLPKAGRLGAVVSVYTVEKYGTQTHSFTWNDIKRRYRQNFNEKL